MSFFENSRSGKRKKLIAALDLSPFVAKAKELFDLKSEDVEFAEEEYREFLYLVYWNRRLEGAHLVVPTKRADKIWHAHILDTRNYASMCQEIFGTFIHHQVGLDEGTDRHKEALIHTKRLHRHVYNKEDRPGFDPDYLFEGKEEKRQEQARKAAAEATRRAAENRRPAPTPPSRQTSRSSSGSSRRRSDDDGIDVSLATILADNGHHGGNHSPSDHSFGGGSFGGGGASGSWDSGGSSSSDSGSSGSSCGGGGGCGGD